MPPSSPIAHTAQQEWPTPIRAKVRSDRFEHSMTYQSISDTRDIPYTSVYDICNAPLSRRGANYKKTKEARGVKSKITLKDVRQIDKILEEDGFYARALI